MQIDDNEQFSDLETRTEVKCGGCGRVLFAAATKEDEDSDFHGYKVVEPFAMIPSLVRIISEETLPNGDTCTVRETPEVCLRPECFVAVVRHKKWTVVDFAAERAKHRARYEAARAGTSIAEEDAKWRAEEEARRPLQERSDKARQVCLDLLGVKRVGPMSAVFDAAASTFMGILLGEINPVRVGKLRDAFHEAANAQRALDAHYAATYPQRMVGRVE